MPQSLPAGWTMQPVYTLGTMRRAGGEHFRTGRRSQIRGVRMPGFGRDDWALLVVNELTDLRAYAGLPSGEPVDLSLRLRVKDKLVRLGYTATGIPDGFRYCAALPRAGDQSGAWDLIEQERRAVPLQIATYLGTGEPLHFDNVRDLHPVGGVPEVIDWRRDGRHDLLLVQAGGKIVRYQRDPSTETVKFDLTPQDVIAGIAPIGCQGERPAFACVVDWDHAGKSDLLIGTEDGDVLLYRDIGEGEVAYARPQQLRDARGYLQVKGPACPTILHEKGKRYLLVADGEGFVWSWSIDRVESLVASDLGAATGFGSVSESYERGQWWMRDVDGRRCLIAGPNPPVTPPAAESRDPLVYESPAPELQITPPKPGAYEIHITLRTPSDWQQKPVIVVRLSDDETSTVLRGGERHQGPRQEIYFKTADLTGRTLCLKQLEGALTATGGLPVCVESIRLVPVRALPKAKPRKKRIPVGGILDAVMWTLEYKTDSPQLMDEFMARHRQAGIDVMHYKLGGGTWEYPSRVPEAHSVVPDLPSMTAADKAFCAKRIALQEGINWVELAAKACKRHGITCLGWLRVQNHGERIVGKGPLDAFYVNHPEYREKNIDGSPVDGKLCLGYPEVRAFHVAICAEAMDLGCDGIMVETLRHLPKVMYGDPILELFQQRYGLDMRTLPPVDERVVALQCDVFHTFLCEIRDAIRRKKPDAIMQIRVCKAYPMMGVDPVRMAHEGVMNEIIIEDRTTSMAPDIAGVVAACKGTECGAGAVFARTRWGSERMPLHPYRIDREVADYLKAGADSITFYETAHVIDHPEFCRAIRRINDSAELPSRVFLP